MAVSLGLLALAPALAWLVGGLLSRPGHDYRQQAARTASIGGGLLALLGAMTCIGVLVLQGPQSLQAPGVAGQLLLLRIDAVSIAMVSLISFVGTVVVRFSHGYLSGDPRQAAFLSYLCQTLASVSLLVVAGSVWLLLAAWVAMSLSLHRLLLFYPDRPRAHLAARKKFFLARCGDLALALAALLLVLRTGTADIAVIAELAANPKAPPLTAPALFLVLAAILKSAQFPTHGWLAEVMEAPTPVSALLHAGIVNAGGFLIIRFADVIVTQGPALYLLLLVGGLTALFGSLVMMTQRTIKGALAYSTVAQMGFMLLQCGLGAFASAQLHIIAHSLYKAHAFLSSGSVVDMARGRAAAEPSPAVRLPLVLASLGIASVIFFTWSNWMGMTLANKPAIVGLGAILVLGAMHLLIQSGREAPSFLVLARAATTATVVAGLYFTLQALAAVVFETAVPAAGPLNSIQVLLMGFVLLAFGGITALQWYLPAAEGNRRWQAFWVHLSNGFYINQLINQFMALSDVESRASR